jgi:K+-sensing histidine kinase KdpD
MSTAAIARSILTPSRVWRVAAQSLLAILALTAVTLISARLQPTDLQLTSAALLYLLIVVLLSLNGSFASAATVSLVAVLFLTDLAAPPLFSVSFDEPLELIASPVFLTTALVITRLVSRMRGSLQRLRISLASGARSHHPGDDAWRVDRLDCARGQSTAHRNRRRC